jgi:PPOX class probable FMN-dependent enzyme
LTIVSSVEQLEALYGVPNLASTAKVADHVTAHYRTYIEASPFLALATVGPEGLDCTPRGDRPGFIRVADPKTLMMPDRRGNNRIDSLRNIVRDPRVALMFLVPGLGNALRVNGRAQVSIDTDLCESFSIDHKAPRSVIVIQVDEIYFQCARAIMRAELWNPALHRSSTDFPSAGAILAALSDHQVGGVDYDREWPARAAETMW